MVFFLIIFLEFRVLKQIIAHPDCNEDEEAATEAKHRVWDEYINNLEVVPQMSSDGSVRGGTFHELVFAITGKQMCSMYINIFNLL